VPCASWLSLSHEGLTPCSVGARAISEFIRDSLSRAPLQRTVRLPCKTPRPSPPQYHSPKTRSRAVPSTAAFAPPAGGWSVAFNASRLANAAARRHQGRARGLPSAASQRLRFFWFLLPRSGLTLRITRPARSTQRNHVKFASRARVHALVGRHWLPSRTSGSVLRPARTDPLVNA
jgi:hypothetical protein